MLSPAGPWFESRSAEKIFYILFISGETIFLTDTKNVSISEWKLINESLQLIKIARYAFHHPPIAQLVERRTVELLSSLGPWFESGSAEKIFLYPVHFSRKQISNIYKLDENVPISEWKLINESFQLIKNAR